MCTKQMLAEKGAYLHTVSGILLTVGSVADGVDEGDG
jgi:hypothetical protein